MIFQSARITGVPLSDKCFSELPVNSNECREARDILKSVRGLAFTEFLKEDVVRHPLVARIVAAYESSTKQTP